MLDPDKSEFDLSLTRYYWWCQAVGWLGFLAIYILFVLPSNRLNAQGIESADRLLIVGVYIALLGFTGSHLLRLWFKSQKWIELSIPEFWKRAIAATFIVALGASLIEIPILALVDTVLPPPEALLNAFQELGPVASALPFRVFRSSLFMWVIYLSWGGIYWGLKTWNRNREMGYRNEALRMQQKIAELKLLNQQLNPHFLFNSLNNIRSLIYVDKDRASEMISALSVILRNTLEQQHELILLKDELEIVDSFLDLEKVRLENRLKIERDWSAESLDIKIPPMFLQTLVENAVKHGISKRIEGGLLQLGSTMHEDGVQIDIVNEGRLDKESKGLGIGLDNCKERLRLLYGSSAKLKIYQNDKFVHTELFIPVDH